MTPPPTRHRTLVAESWQRSLAALHTPDAATPRLVWESPQLQEVRRSHPLAAIMPVIQRLLIQPSHDSGLVIAVGDEHGRLLWVEGDGAARRRAAGINFAAGADWSEARVGTSAPGTALALDRGVQIAGEEHFNPAVHSWSCTAVPVHDPETGSILGIVDITGDAQAVGANTLFWIQAAVAAAEAELRVARLERLGGGTPLAGARRGLAGGSAGTPLYRDSLQILGRDQGELRSAGRSLILSERHTEILLALAQHPQGLSAEALTALVYPPGTSMTSVRAELVRLRKLLQELNPELVPTSRPYRLPRELTVDAEQALSYLNRGAHRLALGIYAGPALPRSEAPLVMELRTRLALLLREAILSDASPEVLLSYLRLPDAADDAEAWRVALRLLPPRSPRRAAVVAHLESLEQ